MTVEQPAPRIGVAVGEQRARLVYTAGDRSWEVDVPLESGSVNAALLAMPAALEKLKQRVRAAWLDELKSFRATRGAGAARVGKR